jgi:hypothetical protein
VGLAHLVRKVDVQSSHPGSSPQEREFRFLLFKNKIIVGASPTVFLFKKKVMEVICVPQSMLWIY